ncbi:tyrosine-type recombinase/integrase [Bradyrhizobium elkanii]|uniref:tyrosine-type recombinase/integrase n=1 Tax=Bradyrhizobium elkanii TaxID=29448 RepID=UPI001448B642|nr:integrase family protein [Bradyrhizobium elkanii]MCS3576555.1 integrase [Bradyrhizobium elkanii]MCS3719444.1 integrase [Bradyrhizobium elkanii]MCS4003849.1 integrase [Bradyrhizobium elkanii USDA 61]BBB99013.1 DNA integration/recombination/invertion protein [Bradyrhizobium elkanii USDA 61]
MGRPRKDGSPAKEVHRRKLTDMYVQALKGGARNELIWDERCPHLALSVRTTGYKSWSVIYRHSGKPRWFLLGDVRDIGLADARKMYAKVMLDVANGKDPVAERQAQRDSGTFADLARTYVELWAKKHNKSYRQAERLVARYLLPRLGKLKANQVSRSDVRGAIARISAPIVANQVLASASAIFSWAIRQEILAINPCKGIDSNPTKDRERVLSDSELRLLWPRLDAQLKLLLLTGQRPGEVAAMRRQDIVEGWWKMSGDPVGDWPGTKNGRDHRVFLSDPAAALIPLHLQDRRTAKESGVFMRKLVQELNIERATPHDLRRTALTKITSLGFGRDAMDRIANHRKKSVTNVYDRHGYEVEDQRIMEAVARKILSIVNDEPSSNVVPFAAA